jgi:hypothetical protein
VDYVRNPTRVNIDPQEVTATRKSTRLQKYGTSKKQDFMVKGNSNSKTRIEGNTKDMGVDTNNSRVPYKPLCDGNCRGKPLFTSSGDTKLHNQSPHQLKGATPFAVYHRNVRGLRGKVNDLLCQLRPTFPHALCLSEHHMNYLELQQVSLDSYRLGVG